MVGASPVLALLSTLLQTEPGRRMLQNLFEQQGAEAQGAAVTPSEVTSPVEEDPTQTTTQQPGLTLSSGLSELGGMLSTLGAGTAPQQDSWQFRLGSLVAQQAQNQMQSEQNKLMMKQLYEQNVLGQKQVAEGSQALNAQGISVPQTQTQVQQPQVQQIEQPVQSGLGSMNSLFGGQGLGNFNNFLATPATQLNIPQKRNKRR